MYQYFAFNISFSLLVFLYLYLLKTAPFRVRFWLVMGSLASWLVPYDVLFDLLNQKSTIYTSTEISQFNGLIKQSIAKQVNTVTFITPISLFISLTIVGFLIFIKDVISLKHHLKKHSSKSLLHKKIKSTHVYKVQDSDNIFTVGLFNPKVYIGDRYINSKTFPNIIQHELQHIKNNDQVWLLFITFVQKIFWWNPIVLIQSKKAREYIELSCDEICKQNSPDNSYQRGLAQILLNQHKSSNPLTNSMFGKSRLNIYRIKQLTKEFKMKKTHKAICFITAITPLLLLPLVSTSSVFVGKTIYDENGEVYTLKENQVDLEYSISVKSNKNTRKIESRIIAEYGKKQSYGRDSNIFAASKFQPTNPTNIIFEITVRKVDEKSVMVEALVLLINNKGEKNESTPSIWVENGKEASIVINEDYFEIELMVKPNF